MNLHRYRSEEEEVELGLRVEVVVCPKKEAAEAVEAGGRTHSPCWRCAMWRSGLADDIFREASSKVSRAEVRLDDDTSARSARPVLYRLLFLHT